MIISKGLFTTAYSQIAAKMTPEHRALLFKSLSLNQRVRFLDILTQHSQLELIISALGSQYIDERIFCLFHLASVPDCAGKLSTGVDPAASDLALLVHLLTTSTPQVSGGLVPKPAHLALYLKILLAFANKNYIHWLAQEPIVQHVERGLLSTVWPGRPGILISDIGNGGGEQAVKLYMANFLRCFSLSPDMPLESLQVRVCCQSVFRPGMFGNHNEVDLVDFTANAIACEKDLKVQAALLSMITGLHATLLQTANSQEASFKRLLNAYISAEIDFMP